MRSQVGIKKVGSTRGDYPAQEDDHGFCHLEHYQYYHQYQISQVQEGGAGGNGHNYQFR